jgi:hypothetical protein
MRPASAFFAAVIFATPAHADWWEDNSCVRAVPEPALAKDAPGHSFKIVPDQGIAIETAMLDGREISIEHSGCENLTWNIRMALDGKEKPNPAEAWAAAGALLGRLAPHAADIYGIKEARALIAKPPKRLPPLGEFVDLDEDIIRTSLAIDIAEPGHTLTVTLSYGPL